MRNQYWENKHYAYFCNRECEYFPCHKGPTQKILIAYSAIALCMYWEIAAAESLPTFPTDTRTAAAVCFPICGRIMV